MELKLPAINDFLKIWKKDFLGHQGFFIPGQKSFSLGREMTISIRVGDEAWGNAQVLPVWSNIFGPVTKELPRGTFLKIVRAEKDLQQKINNASP